MRLLMFTPATQASAIGRATRLVVGELVRMGHAVSVVRSESKTHLDAPAHDYGVEVVRWDERARLEAIASQSDAIVYHIGDNHEFHEGCLEWLPHRRGVVCLHDYFVGNLFSGWARKHGRDRARLMVESWYGHQIAQSYFDAKTPWEFIERTRVDAPMTEWVCAMASGVVTHSGWDVQRVLRACAGPVEIAGLPYDAPGNAPLSSGALRKGHARGSFHVLTIGQVNANKRAQSIIRAIGMNAELRDRTTYRLVGSIAPSMRSALEALARDLDVRLQVSGEVEQSVLAAAIEDADVMCCLRMPVLEAASASTIESMLLAKPVLVTDAGFYAQLPDSCVVKISVDNEEDDIQRALAMLLHDPESARRMGRRAAAYARETFSASRYAARLLDVCERAAQSNPALEATRFFANALARWGGLSGEESLRATLAPLSVFERTKGSVDAK